jgi:hypothetical protein
MTREQALELARFWAKRGIPAGPIVISWDERKQATNKVPLTRHGHKDFTTDVNRLDALFGNPKAATIASHEAYGVGLWPGPAGRVVLDVDTKAGKQGDKQLAELEAEQGALPPHPIVDTASGGTHDWLAKPKDVHVGNPNLTDDIEIRADDGWVVAAGTITPWGSWTLREGTDSGPCPLWPDWLAARLNGHKSGSAGGARGRWQKLDRSTLDPRDLACLEALEALGGHGAFLGPDGDVRLTRPGKQAGTSATVGYVGPGMAKVFSNDWAPLRKDSIYAVDELADLARGEEESAPNSAKRHREGSDTAPVTLDQCHAVFRRWLGDEYDLAVLDALLCALAVERLDGDPLWLLIISGPGAAKTETVQAAAGAGAIVESTITGEAALLSGTPKKDRAKDATGGLLRKLGDSGVLVIKDVTSVISMSRDRRAEVLAALREVHDGYWSRSMGAEGGRTLTWKGRLVIIGAVTTAWDTAHSVISAMGDRFVSVRLDSGAGAGRKSAGRRTAANTGDEVTMRAELAEVVGGVIAAIDAEADLSITDAEVERLLLAADLVTLARTGVEYDYKGDVIDAHAPEMPTRFLRQLQQIIRGGIALGIDRHEVLDLAIRCARDSMPPVRLAIVDDLAQHPHSRAGDIRRRVELPWRTVDRQCQALYMLGVIACEEVEVGTTSHWYYSLANGIHPDALRPSPDLATPTLRPLEEKGSEGPPTEPPRGTPANSGDASAHVSALADQLRATAAAGGEFADEAQRLLDKLAQAAFCDSCGAALDQHAAPDCDVPVIHRPPDLWSTPND